MTRPMKQLMGWCASCGHKVRRGDYLMCSKGCGARLCRGQRRCIPQHQPNCARRATSYTDSPQEAG
ncbi:hypothetical protein [Streptomyces sp. NRRL S-4]|uniref:hypothetical protein n=1 Tax=Streptomyces sp. NRRL S-4 TaxID=1519471 RepID=UPI0006B447FA|nr:hypothetical protein [Streptomyces sp. NRRL S-4]KPC79536.1 hypothetical protein ADK82_25750 [Streptomyces sp. NRRL S-4]